MSFCPWPSSSVGQSTGSLSQYAKVQGLIPGQGTCKNQPINNKEVEKQIDDFLSLSQVKKFKKTKCHFDRLYKSEFIF